MRFQKDIPVLIRLNRFVLILFFIAASTSIIFAQNRKELEERRKRLIKEISQTTNLLEQTKKNKTATLNRYLTLQKQIRKRKQLVNTLKKRNGVY